MTLYKVQTTCPTKTGRKIDKPLYVDHNGKRIHMCCKACVKKVKKAPAKYIKKLEDEGVVLDRVPGAVLNEGHKKHHEE